MKQTILATTLSLCLLAPSAQAQQHHNGNPPTAEQPQALPKTEQSDQAEQQDKRIDKKSLFKKAGIGCAIGGAFAFLTKNKDKAVEGCALGAVAGGLLSYKEQLDDARAIEQAAKQAGMNARVQTREVSDKEGNKGRALDALVVSYDPKDMASMSEQTSATLSKIANLAKHAKNKLTFTFTGKTSCSIPIKELQTRGAFEGHTVMDRCGQGANAITISPMPEV